MAIWTSEIKELERLLDSLKDHLPTLEKELTQLIRTEDPNVLLLYSRRCLEVIITDLCECELKRDRGTEPLKGIIDKLNKEKKVPSHIITSMHGLNDLSTYGTHPKDFDQEQVKPVLSNLDVIIKWYLRFKGLGEEIIAKAIEEPIQDIKTETKEGKRRLIQNKKYLSFSSLILLIALIVIIVLYFNNKLVGGKLTRGYERSIAVLPFINDSPSDSNQYFINGFMEDVLNHLQTIKDLHPISRTSAEKYRKTTKSITEIAKELGVNYIVEGDMQRYGNSIRLSVNLFKALKKELKLWGRTYEQKINDATDVLSLQSQIAQSIAGELEAVITPKEKQLIERIPTNNLDAYDAYTKGMFYYWKLTKNNLDTAMRYFEQAKDKDPKYAPAYKGIADVWFSRVQLGFVSFTEGSPKYEEALMKANELDNTVDLCLWYTFDMWDWEKGEEEFKKAIERNPNDALARADYSALLLILGRDEEAMKQIEIAVKLDPLNAFTTYQIGSVLEWSHKYQEAIKAYRDALKIEPNNNFAIGDLGVTFALTGMYKEAVEQWELANANANDTELVNALKKGYSELGYMGAQHSYLKVVESRFKNSYWPPTDIASTYALIVDNDKALYWLDQAFKVHDPPVTYLLSPVYDNLRDDPRFKALCQKMKLPHK